MSRYKNYEPRNNEVYYYIDLDALTVNEDNYADTKWDEVRLENGNYFLTEEEAENKLDELLKIW